MYIKIEIEGAGSFLLPSAMERIDPHWEPDVFEFSLVVLGKNAAPMES